MFRGDLSSPALPSRRFLAGLLVVIAAFLLALRLSVFLRWTPDFVLVALIMLAFFLGFFELLFLVALSVGLLIWEPAISVELVMFAAIPIAIILFRKVIFPLEGWLSGILSVVAGLFVFYGAPLAVAAFENYRTLGAGGSGDIFGSLSRAFSSDLFGEYQFIFGNLGFGIIFGFFVFQVFDYFYGERLSSE